MKIVNSKTLNIFILILQYFYKWLSTLIFNIKPYQLLLV